MTTKEPPSDLELAVSRKILEAHPKLRDAGFDTLRMAEKQRVARGEGKAKKVEKPAAVEVDDESLTTLERAHSEESRAITRARFDLDKREKDHLAAAAQRAIDALAAIEAASGAAGLRAAFTKHRTLLTALAVTEKRYAERRRS